LDHGVFDYSAEADDDSRLDHQLQANRERSFDAMDHGHDDDFQLRKAGMVATIIVVSIFVVAMIGVITAMD
jgi:hypothetical protein